jgi:hypothetical protein
MPIRRLNYTARRRIRRADAAITLRTCPDGSFGFDADLRLAAYQFPADARVIVEAYRQTYLMRFDFGTVSVPVAPAERTLSEFESEAEVLFRVRVTAASGRSGILLGEVDRLRPVAAGEEPDKRMPLLPPVPGDIGEEVWRVEFEGKPILRVNSRLPDWRQTVLSDTFRALVYPEACRQVLQAILLREGYQFVEDFADWRSCWLLFASRIPGAGAVPKDKGEYEDWIENAVEAFARQFTMCARFEAELKRSA